MDNVGASILGISKKIVLKLYLMKQQNSQLIHFSMPYRLFELLNKEAFTTGMSKQELLRQIVRKHFTDALGYDVLLDKKNRQHENP